MVEKPFLKVLLSHCLADRLCHKVDWGEYLKVKEDLAVKIINIVDDNSAGFAFPSQSLYVESYPKEKPEIFNPKT